MVILVSSGILLLVPIGRRKAAKLKIVFLFIEITLQRSCELATVAAQDGQDHAIAEAIVEACELATVAAKAHVVREHLLVDVRELL